jgi:UDP-N-acetylmuramoyl-tripeptide--D-alanyl-D-alanine ligase
MKLDINFVIDSVDGNFIAGHRQGTIVGVSTDSRKVNPGELFIALQGENFDGHNYIADVWKAGAAAVVVSKPVELPPDNNKGAVILVGDTLEALQKLAGRYRQLFNIPIIAITGSVGKTTTKDMLAESLATVYKTVKTPGNYNNEIGLPLTLLGINEQHQAAVVEMAMRAAGEIANLARIVRPTYAIITNVEPVHLETMKTIDNIARAKCELLQFIDRDKFALINGDNELLLKSAAEYPNPKYTFGYSNKCDIQIIDVENDGIGIRVGLRLLDVKESFYCPVPAKRLAPNIAAAAGLAYLMGVKPENIKKGIAIYKPSANRLKIINLSLGGAIIDDTYNANPLSMMSALEVCQHISAGRKTVAVLGDMFELGDFEKEGHFQVGERVAKLGLDRLVTIGQRAEYIEQGALLNGMPNDRVVHFGSREASLSWLKKHVGQNEVILFKGSRAMQLDKLVEAWLD